MTDAERPSPALWRRVTGSAWFHLVLAVLVVSAVLSFVAKPYWVPSSSMEQTLQIDDRVLVNRLAYVGPAHPSTGEIIVFDADESWGEWGSHDDGPVKAVLRWLGEVSGFGPSGPHTLIKRVIGAPGQTVACCSAEGAVTVDGVALDESYVFEDLPFEPGVLDCTTTPMSPRCLPEVTVPEDSYLVMGDHRSVSADSAYGCRGLSDSDDGCWLWARDQDVVGRASAILWPVSRWSGL